MTEFTKLGDIVIKSFFFCFAFCGGSSQENPFWYSKKYLLCNLVCGTLIFKCLLCSLFERNVLFSDRFEKLES